MIIIRRSAAGVAPAAEDELCAEYIKSLVEGYDLDLCEGIEMLRHTSGAKFFDPAQEAVFPRGDFAMCTDVDRFDFVIKLNRPKGEIPYMTKERIR